MCYHCWSEDGCPVLVPSDVMEIVGWIEELYEQPDGDMGGPLHVELDDFNVGCPWVPFDAESHGFDPWTPKTLELCHKISKRMLELKEPVRAAVLAVWEKWLPLDKTIEMTWE